MTPSPPPPLPSTSLDVYPTPPHPSVVGDGNPRPFHTRLDNLGRPFPDQGLAPRLLLVARQLQAVAVLALNLKGKEGKRKGKM